MTRRFWRYLEEAVSSLRRGWRSSVLALATIISAVFVLGTFLIVSAAVDATLRRWAGAAEISVFLRDDAGPEARAAVERALRGHDLIGSVQFVDAAEARRRFARAFPDLAALLAEAGDAPLPASVEARVAPGADASRLARVADEVRALAGVADVRLDQQLLQRVNDMITMARVAGAALAGILVFAAALSVVSVVRLSYVARQDEVEILHLLGAPLSAIRGPYVVEGALQGLLGATAGVALLAVVRAWIVRVAPSALRDAIGTGHVAFLGGQAVALLLAGGLVLGAWAGWTAVRGRRVHAAS